MKISMRKLSVLLYHREKPMFLEKLQELGVVHVDENPEATSKKLVALREEQRSADKVVKALKLLAKEAKQDVNPVSEGDPEQLIRRFEALDARREHIEQHQASYRKERSILEPWGDYDLDTVSRLREAGIRLRFYTTTAKRFEALDKQQLQHEVINQIGTTVYFVVVERGERPVVDAEEVLLPSRSLSEIDAELAKLDGDARENYEKRLEMTKYLPVLERCIRETDAKASFEAARLSTEEAADGRVVSLVGWVPVDKRQAVEQFLGNFSLWYSLDDPAPGEAVPIKLRNGKASSLFEPIINIYSLPDYFELDPTPFVAPFFAIFFGLSLGDVGYGLLLLIGAIIGYFKLPEKLKPIMTLGMILGVCTAGAGVFLDTVFGQSVFSSNGGQTIALLSPVETESGTFYPAMPFALYLGVFQIIFGMVLKMYNQIRYEGAIYGVQPVSTILLLVGGTIFLAKANFIDMGQLELGAVAIGDIITSTPQWLMNAFFVVGLALLLLFNNPTKAIFIRPLTGLWELYNFVTGMMSYGLSYLRIFALGLAGGLLGAAINQIAFMMITQPDGTVSWGTPLAVGTILVLIFGHALNLALSSLGAFVHPLRLTFVEFYGSMEFRGGGKPYKPLSKPQ